MLWLVPHLFADARLLEVAAHGLQLPGLQTLLARGTHGTAPAAGTEASLCDELGIARQSDCPWAPLTLEADGIEAGAAYWLRADPACFQLMRDRIVLAATGPATAVPLLLFAFAVQRLRLTTIGMLQYIGPSIQFLLAIFVFRESINATQLFSFGLIWLSLAIYSADSMLRRRAAA